MGGISIQIEKNGGKKKTGELRNGVKKKHKYFWVYILCLCLYCITYPLGKNPTDNGVYKRRRSVKKSAAAKAISAVSSIYKFKFAYNMVPVITIAIHLVHKRMLQQENVEMVKWTEIITVNCIYTVYAPHINCNVFNDTSMSMYEYYT